MIDHSTENRPRTPKKTAAKKVVKEVPKKAVKKAPIVQNGISKLEAVIGFQSTIKVHGDGNWQVRTSDYNKRDLVVQAPCGSRVEIEPAHLRVVCTSILELLDRSPQKPYSLRV